MDRRAYDPGTWNLVAVAEPGTSGSVLSALGAFGRFRSTPYPGVLIGHVAGSTAAEWVLAAHRSEPAAFRAVLRLVPLERTLGFERDDVTEALCSALERECPRLAGRTFHVRARLRGLKGRLETQALERALGAFLYRKCEALEEPSTVRFDDPDIVVAVQVVGRQVGFSFLDRTIREVPLVRPR